MTTQRFFGFLGLVVTMAGGWIEPTAARGATYTWTGAGFMGDQDFLWSNPFNWQGAAAPSAGEANVNLVFPNSGAPRNTTNDIVGLTVASIQFQGANYTVAGKPSGNALGLSSSSLAGFSVSASASANDCQFVNSSPLNLMTPGLFQVSGANTLKLRSRIGGAAGFTKTGPGTLLLAALQANTYAGTTYVADGVLALDSASIALPPATPTPQVSVPGALVIGGTDPALSPEVRLLNNEQIANDAVVTVNANGRLDLAGRMDEVGPLVMVGGTVTTEELVFPNSPGQLRLSGNVTNRLSAVTNVSRIYGKLDLGLLSRTIHVETNTLLHMEAGISGSSILNPGITKTGGGQLTFWNNPSSYSGATVVQEGALKLHGGTSLLGSDAAGTVVHLGAQLVLQEAHVGEEPLTLHGGPGKAQIDYLVLNSNSWAGPITLNGDCRVQGYHVELHNDGLTLSGAISGTGSLRKIGDGRLHLKGLGANTFTGGLFLESGVTVLDKEASASALAGPLEIGHEMTGEFAIVRVNRHNQIPNNVPVTLHDSAILTCAESVNDVLGNLEFFGGQLHGVFTLAGNITNRNGASDAIIHDGLILTANEHVVHCEAGANLLVNGVLQGQGAVTKTGSGPLEFGNANTYAGATWVKQGILRLIEDGLPGSPLVGTRIEPAGQLHLSDVSVTNEILTLSGLNLADQVMRASGNCRWKGPIVLDSDCAVVAFGDGNLILDGPISGPGGLGFPPLPGATVGTVQLVGNTPNTYSGPTVIEAGTLWLSKVGAPAIPGSLTIGLPTNGAPDALVVCMVPGQFASVPQLEMATRHVTVNPSGWLQCQDNDQTVANLILRGGGVTTFNGGMLSLLGDVTALSAEGNDTATVFGVLRLANPSAGSSHHLDVESGVQLKLFADLRQGPAYATLQKLGAGDLQLLGSNSFNAHFTISAGRVLADGVAPFGTSQGGTFVEEGASLNVTSGEFPELLLLSGPGNGVSSALHCTGTARFTETVKLISDAVVSCETNAQLTFSGPVTDVGGLTKAGAGLLRLAGSSANDYGGITTVLRGTLELAKTNAIAVPQALHVVDRNVAGTRLVRWMGSNQVADGSAVTLDDSAIANLNGQDEVVGSLSGSGQVSLGSGSLTVGGDGSSTSFLGVITGLGGSLTKAGSGTFALEGNNTYTGTTTVNGGILLVNGQQPQSAISLMSGGQLGGMGRVGNLSDLNGHVAPGGSPGILVCNNYSTFAPANLLKVDITGPVPGAGHDQLHVFGIVLLMGGTLQLSLSGTGAVSNEYVIIKNDGPNAVSGTFTGLAEGASLTNNGAAFVITYHGGDGNDVVLIQQTIGDGIKLAAAKMLINGTVQLTGTGEPNVRYNIEAAPNLNTPIDWQRIGSANADANGAIEFVDADAPNFAMQFYRFVKP